MITIWQGCVIIEVSSFSNVRGTFRNVAEHPNVAAVISNHCCDENSLNLSKEVITALFDLCSKFRPRVIRAELQLGILNYSILDGFFPLKKLKYVKDD